MKFLRKIFFYVFTLIYIVLCPLTILYALGYVFRPGSQEGIIRTGLIYLSTAPPGATVYLGEKRYSQKTPAIIRNLLPGEYTIKLKLNGYRPWQQAVPLEAEKATVLERILLLPEEFRKQVISTAPFNNLIPLPGTHFFLIYQGPKVEDIFVYDFKEQRLWPLVSSYSLFKDFKVLSFFTAPDSTAFILRVDFQGGEKYLRLKVLKEQEIHIEDITALFPDRPSRIEWDSGRDYEIFTYQNNYLNRLDVNAKAIYPKFLENIRGYGISEKMVYALTENNLFLKTDYEGKDKTMLLDDAKLRQFFLKDKGRVKIFAFTKDILVFLGEQGELMVNRIPYRLVDEGILGLEFEPRSKRLLFWTNNKLGILDFSKEAGGADILEKRPKLTWVYKEGKRIVQAFWVYEGAYILFKDENKIFLIELETYGKPRLSGILETDKNSSVVYSEEFGKLFFVEKSTRNLASMEILPTHEVLFTTFPGKKEEKKEGKIQGL